MLCCGYVVCLLPWVLFAGFISGTPVGCCVRLWWFGVVGGAAFEFWFGLWLGALVWV